MPVSVTKHAEISTFPHAAGGWVVTELYGEAHKDHPTSCGVGVLEPGPAGTFEYPFYEYATVLEGEAQIVDASKPGEAKTVAAGDVIHVEKGTTVTWTATKKLKFSKQPGDFNVGLVSSDFTQSKH